MFKVRSVYVLMMIVLVSLSAAPVFGAGFALYEGSARGNVLGAALTASADDPSAIFYNPAGITQLKGVQTMIGATIVTPDTTVETSGASNSFKRNWFLPPHAYVTYQINDKWWAGIGTFTRFGLGTEFDQTWPGRFNSYHAKIQELEINPNIAFKINNEFSVAAGVNAMWFDLSLSRKLPPVSYYGVPTTDFKLAGDSWGYGWNIAAQYKPSDCVQAGISFRSRVKQSVKGTATTNPSSPVYPTVDADGDITLPAMLFAGLNFNVNKTLSIGGGIYWTEWQSYDKLQINFAHSFAGMTTMSSQKDWKNVFRYMIGGEWKAAEHCTLRLGYAFDQAPGPDETVDYIAPDSDRHLFSIGAGYHKDKWGIDISYTYILITDRDIAGTVSGTYPGKFSDGSAHLVGLSLSYKF